MKVQMPPKDKAHCSTSRFKVFIGTLSLTVMAMTTSGCGSAPTMVDAECTLLVDQKPAEGATIMLFPKSSSARFVATGTSGADGKFRLVTNLKPGIPVGEYDVTVVWPDPSVKPSLMQQMQGLADDATDLLKGKYAIRSESGLSAEIKKDTKEIPVLQLSTAP
jgi:hypothetical protein